MASNLVAGDTNNLSDAYVYDIEPETFERLSIKNGGGQSSGASFEPSLADGGRYAVFESTATDLTSINPNGTIQVYLRDREQNTTEIISVNDWSPYAAGQYQSAPATISANGKKAAFNGGSNLLGAYTYVGSSNQYYTNYNTYVMDTGAQ